MTAGRFTARTEALRRASSGLMDFISGPLMSRRRASPDPCDLLFGNPQEPALPGLVEAIRAAAVPQGPEWFAYKFSEEAPRRAVATALTSRLRMPFDPADILLTKGASGALAVVLQTVLEPGDEVLYVRPPWFFYEAMIISAGGTAVAVDCDPVTFDLDVDAITAAISPYTRAIIVNSPNNPTGRIYPPATLRRLADVLEVASQRNGRRVYLISDEAYQRIVFPGTTFVSPTSCYPHSFLLYSYGKTLLAPGQRLGYVALPPGLPHPEELRSALFLGQMAAGTGWPDAIMQYALPQIEELCIDLDRLRRRRDLLVRALTGQGYDVHSPEGTFYLFPRSPIPDDEKFAALLADREVFVLPGHTVERPGYLRISLTASDAMVERSVAGFAAAYAQAVGGAAAR
jgi:aspartate aminotransferase